MTKAPEGMRVYHAQGDPKTLTLLEDNARFMPHGMFETLVNQIRQDGVLQQWPFVWLDTKTGDKHVLSGNHRVKASIQAGLDLIDWTECDDPLMPDAQRRIQLAHNAISGQDDPVILKRLYDSITDVEERLMTGLDDATLDLLRHVDTASLSEANLDFAGMLVLFLPPEFERALKAFDEARKMGDAKAIMAARFDQHHAVLDALEDARESAHVMNAATAFDILLDVWDRHREDLADGWLTTEGELRREPKASEAVPVTSVLGTTMPAHLGARLAKMVRDGREAGTVKSAWEVLESLLDRDSMRDE
jgi:hypothetical protein